MSKRKEVPAALRKQAAAVKAGKVPRSSAGRFKSDPGKVQPNDGSIAQGPQY